MDENKELNNAQLGNVAGGEGEKRHHTCGICGEEMNFLREQQGASPYVFICPRCSNVDVFNYM